MTTGSRSDYAAHIGKSPAYVTKLGHQGRLVERDEGGRRVVDFELTDRLIRNTTDMGRSRNGVNAKPGSTPSLPVAPIAEAGRVDAIFRQAQAQERAYNAKIAEIEYRQRAGELVRLSDVTAEYTRLLVALRETFLQLPSRVVPMLVADPSASAMDRVLRDEIVTALRVVAEAEGKHGVTHGRA